MGHRVTNIKKEVKFVRLKQVRLVSVDLKYLLYKGRVKYDYKDYIILTPKYN